jgi:small subunit ribosomal protein S8
VYRKFGLCRARPSRDGAPWRTPRRYQEQLGSPYSAVGRPDRPGRNRGEERFADHDDDRPHRGHAHACAQCQLGLWHGPGCRCPTRRSRPESPRSSSRRAYVAGSSVEEATVGSTLVLDLKYGPNRERPIAGVRRAEQARSACVREEHLAPRASSVALVSRSSPPRRDCARSAQSREGGRGRGSAIAYGCATTTRLRPQRRVIGRLFALHGAVWPSIVTIDGQTAPWRAKSSA